MGKPQLKGTKKLLGKGFLGHIVLALEWFCNPETSFAHSLKEQLKRSSYTQEEESKFTETLNESSKAGKKQRLVYIYIY